LGLGFAVKKIGAVSKNWQNVRKQKGQNPPPQKKKNFYLRIFFMQS